jgi:CubicO group peptidase (beta-lactamase class C family)
MYTVSSMSTTASHGLPFADANEVGMSAERLARIEDRFKTYVDESLIAGWALTIAREGKVALSAQYGLADRENNKPIADDTIYRIFSMTKPITAVAAMMLWEEGKFELHDHVSKFSLVEHFSSRRSDHKQAPWKCGIYSRIQRA